MDDEKVCFSELKIPNLNFLEFGNVYTGSWNNFNFKIIPTVELKQFQINVWFGKNCFSKSKINFKKVFNLNVDDLNKAQKWLNSVFKKN